MDTSLAELAVLALLVYGVYLALEPLRRRVERWLLRLLDSPKADIVDAQTVKDGRSRRNR